MTKVFFTVIANYWQLLSLIMLVGITVLSLMPLPELPQVPGGDKAHHFIGYGLLVFPVALRQPKYWMLIAFVFAVWSGGIELIQPYLNRYGEWLDLAANCVGLIIGITFGVMIREVIQKDSKEI